MALEAESAISFRQVGKRSQGLLVRGATRPATRVLSRGGRALAPPFAGNLTGQHSGSRHTASIPSKFETTLYTGAKERNAFGSRAYRFSDNEVRRSPRRPPPTAPHPRPAPARQNELPGPGAYEETAKFKDDKVYSKKGLGVGFVSRAKRSSGWAGSSSAPGPGAYEQAGSAHSLVRALDQTQQFNRSGTTSAFKRPSAKSVSVAEDPMPGPGQYDRKGQFGPPVSHYTGKMPARRIEAAAPTRQIRYTDRAAMQREMPAPGQYDPRVPEQLHHDDALPTSAFRSAVPIGRDKQIQAAHATKEQQLGVVKHEGDVGPGPGQYATATSAFPNSRRRSPQFCDSMLDRFGRPLRLGAQDAGPGPGQYHREVARDTAPISGSAFMSGTQRDRSKDAMGQPGPAYYVPEDAKNKRSYHLNVAQRWMPAT
jgi:hypothetical protein